MNYYLYRPDANNFAGIGVDMDDDEKVTRVHFDDSPLIRTWKPRAFHGFPDNPIQEGDFPSLTNFWLIPLFSQRAWAALRSVIGNCCEALPIVYPSGEPYYLIHVMETIDCLDEDRSELSRSQIDGRVNRIYKYALKTDMLRGKHIFKLPQKSGRDLIVDDVFREAVAANALKGLLFRELPMAE